MSGISAGQTTRIRFIVARKIDGVDMVKKITIKIKSKKIEITFGENLGAPFIIGFQVLLVACACLLVQGNSVLANDVAVSAYYLLVVGVVLQLVCFIKHGKKAAE